jgi:hypothetical protein
MMLWSPLVWGFAVYVQVGAGTGLLPDRTLLSEPSIRRKVHLTTTQERQVQEIIAAAEAQLKQDRSIAREAISHAGMVARIARPKLESVDLDSDQVAELLAISLRGYGPFVLEYPGLAGGLEVSDKTVATVSREQSKLQSAAHKQEMEAVRKWHLRTVTLKGGGVVAAPGPAIDPIEARLQRDLWNSVNGNLTKAQRLELARVMTGPFDKRKP